MIFIQSFPMRHFQNNLCTDGASLLAKLICACATLGIVETWLLHLIAVKHMGKRCITLYHFYSPLRYLKWLILFSGIHWDSKSWQNLVAFALHCINLHIASRFPLHCSLRERILHKKGFLHSARERYQLVRREGLLKGPPAFSHAQNLFANVNSLRLY